MKARRKKPAQVMSCHVFCFIVSISPIKYTAVSPLNCDLSEDPLSCTYLTPGLKKVPKSTIYPQNILAWGRILVWSCTVDSCTDNIVRQDQLQSRYKQYYMILVNLLYVAILLAKYKILSFSFFFVQFCLGQLLIQGMDHHIQSLFLITYNTIQFKCTGNLSV